MGLLGQGFNLGGFTGDDTFVPSGSPASWYDASQITGLSDGANVTQWNDLASTNHLTQHSPSVLPTYQTNEQNGMPIVRFTENNSKLYNASGPTLTKPTTMFFVIKIRTWTQNYRLWDSVSATPNLYAAIFNVSSPRVTIYAGTIWDTGGSSGVVLNTWQVWAVKYDGSNSSFQVNDGTPVTGDIGTGGTGSGFAIGGTGNNHTFGSSIDVGEILLYSGSESFAANVAGLMTKWGIS
jgi:hypothetical protein